MKTPADRTGRAAAPHDDALPVGFKLTELGPLPEEWQVVRLGESVKIIKGRKPATLAESPMSGSLPYLTAEYFRTNIARQYVPSELLPTVEICREQDIVLIWDGSNAGQVFTGLAGVLASTMVKIIPKHWDITGDFAYFYLLTQFENLNSQTTGSTIPHVNKVLFHNLPIPLPPLAEQRAIAHVLGAVQEAKEATERVIAALKEVKKSLMRHLFTYGPAPVGERERVPLRESEIGPVPAHWEVVRLGEVAEIKGGKRLPKGHQFSEEPTPYPYLRVIDFSNGTIDTTNLKFLTSDDHQKLKLYIISSNDVYISIAGTIGLVGTIPEVLNGAHLTENAAKIVITSRSVLKDFLATALQFSSVQDIIQSFATKTSQPKLALIRIKQIPIPLPPLAEQQEIACILQAVDAKIAAEKKRKQALQELFRSLLHHLMTAKRRLPAEFTAKFETQREEFL